MLIRRLKLRNLLSFGPDVQDLELAPLNVLIGPNGSGKSNLIEAFGLMQAAPTDLPKPIRRGGGIVNWLWKHNPKESIVDLECVIDNPSGRQPLRYRLSFTEADQRFVLIEEAIENERPYDGYDQPYLYYEYRNGRATLNYRDTDPDYREDRRLQLEEIAVDQSILAQRKDPDHYPELTYLGDMLDRIRIYREWSFGRYTAPRVPQSADLPNDYLAEDASNLGLVLNRLKREPKIKIRLLSALRQLYDGVSDFDVIIEGGTVQTLLQEDDISIPATRLSDGTLRYLCLLAILHHPNPPPFVCIEEPELGLHPDILPGLATLLREASERSQLVVTTHSDVLVDALTDTAESIVICESHGGQSELRRLDKCDLKPWLEKYRLGELWTSGELGGNRW